MPRLRKKSSSRFSSIPGKASSIMLPLVFAEARFYTPRLTIGLPILNKLDILRLFLRPRPPNTPNFIVVAVDGLDRNAVYLVIVSLYYSITKDL